MALSNPTASARSLATAAVQSPDLMNQLGLTDAEQTGTCRSGIFHSRHSESTRRVHSKRRNQICRIQRRESFESVRSGGAESFVVRAPSDGKLCPTLPFASVLPGRKAARNIADHLSRMGRYRGAEHRDSRLGKSADIERICCAARSLRGAWRSHHHLLAR
jgi:hypothetical protein